jgi:hypothetical protein
MRPLRLVCLFSMLISTMKRAYFVSLFLCLTTTFLFAQLQLSLSGPQSAQGGNARVELQRARPLPNPGPLGPGDRLRREQFSPWNQHNRAFPRNIRRAGMRAANSASNAIFLAAPIYGSGGEDADSVAVADVNGDGKLDLVVANDGSNNVSVLLGNGDGTFRMAVSYGSGGQGADSVAVADVNGDGKLDLVVANDRSNNVSVLLGNGDGTFQAAVSYSSGGQGSAVFVAVADVNGDGKLDLVVANGCTGECATLGSVGVLIGNGDGTFKAAVSYGSGGEDADSVAVADVNGDGKLDLVVANYCVQCSYQFGQVGVLLGNGDGTFQAAVSYDAGYGPDSVAVADVNGDGKLDLVVANYCTWEASCWPYYFGQGGVSVLLGNGDGTFQTTVSYGAGGYEADSVAVADLNGDGKPDLAVEDGNGVSVLLGNGDGTFQAPVSYGAGGSGVGEARFNYGDSSIDHSVAVADVNGDGKPDLLVANYCGVDCTTGGSMGVLLGNGDGTFKAAVSYSTDGFEALSAAVADVNGDGKPDLVVANYSAMGTLGPGNVGVLLGNGDGTFQAAVSYNAGDYAVFVAVADVNGDGKVDLVVANVEFPGVGVLLGNGDGTFQAAVFYFSGGADSVAVADVNGDGKPDLLVANGSGASVLLGNGDGTFQAAVNYDAAGADSIAVADLNGDGKLDLAVTDSSGVSVLLGNGDGTFQAAVNYASGGYEADSVAVADVNGDGKPDLVVANECASSSNCTSGSVGVLLGNGNGTFQAANAFVTAGPNGALAIADFNGDGKLDIASGQADALLLGNGDGTFQSPLTLGASGWGITVGDFNGDGRPDLAVGDVSGIPILLNISRFSTATSIASSSNPSAFDQPVTFTATIIPQYGGSATGTVTFYSGKTRIGSGQVSNNTAKLTIRSLSVGKHSITAAYSGDSNFTGSTSSPLNQVVDRAVTTTMLTSSTNPSRYGEKVTFTATVTGQHGGTSTGTVTFKNGAIVLGKVMLSGGMAKYSTSTLSKGNHVISAHYGGNKDFKVSEEKLIQVVK